MTAQIVQMEKADTWLLALLKDEDPYTRSQAAAPLGAMDVDADAAVPALIEALNDSDLAVRMAACGALGEYGPAARCAAPALVHLLQEAAAAYHDSSPPIVVYDLCEAVSGALQVIEPSAKDFIPLIVATIKTGADLLLQNLGALGWTVFGPEEATEILPILIAALDDSDREVHTLAICLLGQIGPLARAAVPGLMERLRDSDAECRRGAVEALGKIGKDGEMDDALVNLLEDSDGLVRVVAACQLSKSKRHPAALATLLAAMQSPDPPTWRWGIASLKDIGLEREDVRVAVRGALGDPKRRAEAARVLGEIGPDARSFLPELRDLLHETNRMTRVRVAEALWQIAEVEEAIPVLIEEVLDNEWHRRHRDAESYWFHEDIRSFAAQALGEAGPQAAAGVPALITMLSRTHRSKHQLVCDALAKIGKGARAAVPELLVRLRDTKGSVRRAAARALVKIDPEAAARAGIKTG
jgi:HEAT repeat protein